MMQADQIKASIEATRSDFRSAAICGKIIDFIVKEPSNNSKMLTFSSIATIAGCETIDDALISAITVLSTRFRALDMHFVFIDEEGASHFLDDEEARQILQDGLIAHPDTGVLVSRNETNLFPYYEGKRDHLVSRIEE